MWSEESKQKFYENRKATKHRITLDVPKDDYEKIKAYALEQNIPINRMFIGGAKTIMERKELPIEQKRTRGKTFTS